MNVSPSERWIPPDYTSAIERTAAGHRLWLRLLAPPGTLEAERAEDAERRPVTAAPGRDREHTDSARNEAVLS